MSAANRQPSITRTLQLEGDYSNRATDAGGPTKYGITLATLQEWRGASPVLTAADVEQLGEAEADAIYSTRWGTVRGDDLAAGIDWQVFDMQVTSGSHSAKLLQKLLGFTGSDVDGWIGDATLAKLAAGETVECDLAGSPLALVQSYLRLDADGRLGPITRAALQARPDVSLIAALYTAQANFYVSLNEAANTAGWLARARNRLAFALTLLPGASA